MSQASDHALERLNAVFPLAERQAALSPKLRTLHRAFLESLIATGRPMTVAEIAALAPGNDAVSAISTLAAADLIVLGADGNPVGAYPLTVAQTPYLLTVDGNRIQAICAVDAVSVAPMFDKEVTVHSRCSVTGTEIRIEQRGRTVVSASPSSDIQIGFWWREPGSIAARNLCPGIVFLRDRTAAIAWQAGDTRNHDFTSLVDAIDVGARFFGPLIRDTPTPSSTKP